MSERPHHENPLLSPALSWRCAADAPSAAGRCGPLHVIGRDRVAKGTPVEQCEPFGRYRGFHTHCLEIRENFVTHQVWCTNKRIISSCSCGYHLLRAASHGLEVLCFPRRDGPGSFFSFCTVQEYGYKCISPSLFVPLGITNTSLSLAVSLCALRAAPSTPPRWFGCSRLGGRQPGGSYTSKYIWLSLSPTAYERHPCLWSGLAGFRKVEKGFRWLIEWGWCLETPV